VVPAPRPSDAELLSALGIDLGAVRRTTEQRFGVQAVGEATWRVTRRHRWREARVVWTPLCGPPFVAKRALQLAGEQAQAFGHDAVGPEHVLVGVLEDARQPVDSTRGSRRHRRITAHVGLPDGYRGAAGPLLALLGVCLLMFGWLAAWVLWSPSASRPHPRRRGGGQYRQAGLVTDRHDQQKPPAASPPRSA
jgi:hypothetical protein